MSKPHSDIARQIFARTRGAGFQRYLRDLLVELCRVDTTPKADVRQMQAAEDGCSRILERELTGLGFEGARLERRPINLAIQSHPSFSLLHFTKTPQRPQGLSPEETYAGRSNLVYVIPGAGVRAAGQSVALNAHIDVVAPYFPPRVKGESVHGRGACDDKGPVVGIVAALKVLSDVMADAGLSWNRNVVTMLVVEEETGGNGSLSLAIDRDLKKLYDSVMVCECTGLKVHPANRGAVWYRARLKKLPGVSALEMFSFINEEMEKEGAAIRTESRHKLFPQRPVQTCHGIIGPFGEHPSRICGEVGFSIRFERPSSVTVASPLTPALSPSEGEREKANDRRRSSLSPSEGERAGVRGLPGTSAEALVRDCLEAGLTAYVGFYGDKTKVTDPATGKPMVGRHYDLRREGNGFAINVHGATGHMGAIRERDGAITKMAHLVRSLVRSKARLESMAGCPAVLELSGTRKTDRARATAGRDASPRRPSTSSGRLGEASLPSFSTDALIFEGGQGFVPTHDISEVMERLRQAAQRGAENYLRQIGRNERGWDVLKVTYEKLHNVAFDGDPDSPSVRNAIAAAKACGLWKGEPVLGWTVSCDARLFATEYPGMQVLTFGPGQLVFAHSDQEQIALDEIRAAAEFLALFLLRQTGTLGV